MKNKTITTTIVAFMAFLSYVNAGLIISQYVETNSGSHPKGIELWNKTGDTIDFEVTPLVVYRSSGAGDLYDKFTLSTGTLSDGAVMVVGSNQINDYLTDTFGADVVQHHYNALGFSGDDALQIRLGGVVQDTFGTPGTDPGAAYKDTPTSATVQTQNSSIALKSGYTIGDVDGWTDPSERFETVSTNPANVVGADGLPVTGGLLGFGVAPTISDADSDGVGDNSDAFPNDPNESLDSDGDGVGDNTDSYAGYNDAVIGNFLTDFPQSGGGSGDITQEAYDLIVAEKDQAIADLAAAPTQQDLLDARVGSAAVSVTDGTATITLQVEQSDDNMQTWSTPTEGATSVNLPVSGDATFFRVRAQ
jgi:hypothetical protein